MKTCSRCGEAYPGGMFRQDSSKRDGLYPRCRGCTARGGWPSFLRIERRKRCGHCDVYFTPRHNQQRYVKHCSRACAAEAGQWRGDSNGHWKGDEAGYSAVHWRLRQHRGRPSSCEHCGTEDGVLQWALDHEQCDDVLEAIEGPYSVDPADYIGLCVPCHKRLDLDRLTRVAADQLRLEPVG